MAITAISPFQQKIQEMKGSRPPLGGLNRELSVVVLGGGPAGLYRAIESIMNNHKTQVIEKRTEDAGRINVVELYGETIHHLHNYGILQWLIEQHLINPYI